MTKIMLAYLTGLSGGLEHPISWGLGGCVEFSYFLVLHACPSKIRPNCASPLACFKGQMNQNFDLFYFSSILVKCV